MIYLPDKKTRLNMVRGCTMTLEIELTAEDGQPYVLLEGDVVRFGVKHRDGNGAYLILKETQQLQNGLGKIQIDPEDTMALEPDVYAYDIGVQSGTNYFMAVGYSDFVIDPSVTGKE